MVPAAQRCLLWQSEQIWLGEDTLKMYYDVDTMTNHRVLVSMVICTHISQYSDQVRCNG